MAEPLIHKLLTSMFVAKEEDMPIVFDIKTKALANKKRYHVTTFKSIFSLATFLNPHFTFYSFVRTPPPETWRSRSQRWSCSRQLLISLMMSSSILYSTDDVDMRDRLAKTKWWVRHDQLSRGLRRRWEWIRRGRHVWESAEDRWDGDDCPLVSRLRVGRRPLRWRWLPTCLNQRLRSRSQHIQCWSCLVGHNISNVGRACSSHPGERTHDRNLISAVSEIRTHNPLIDSPSCYYWAITALTVSEIFDSNLWPWKFRSRWQCHNICGNFIRSINVVSRLFALTLTVSKTQSFQNFDWKFRPKSIRSGVIRGQISNSLSVVSPIFALILTVPRNSHLKIADLRSRSRCVCECVRDILTKLLIE